MSRFKVMKLGKANKKVIEKAELILKLARELGITVLDLAAVDQQASMASAAETMGTPVQDLWGAELDDGNIPSEVLDRIGDLFGYTEPDHNQGE